MKGIILAGGTGTRLYPITVGVVKQLIPVFDKPMVYYPLSVLMLAGIKDILIITTNRDLDRFKDLFGDGSQLGVRISYAIQNQPKGLAEAFIIGEKFIGNENVCLVLGDNLLYGGHLTEILKNCVKTLEDDGGAVVFGYKVNHPDKYGVVEFDEHNQVISIEEKPIKPKSKYAVIGLYFYDNEVIPMAKSLKPSQRGELEITDINNIYRRKNSLKVELLGRGYAWLDTGSSEDLLKANQFVQTIEHRQGQKIACIEEIAFNQGWISKDQLQVLGEKYHKSSYGQYITDIYLESCTEKSM